MRKDTCVRELCLKRVLARLGVAQSRVCCPTCGAENKCTCEESYPSRSRKKTVVRNRRLHGSNNTYMSIAA
jgi:hypothetical protein